MYKITIILIGTISHGGTSEVPLPRSLRFKFLDDAHGACMCVYVCM